MIPKIRVRPAASMNSSSPYWTLLSSWIRKLAKSIGRIQAAPVRGQKNGRPKPPTCEARRASTHPAAGAGIGQRLGGDADHLVVLVLHAAQVDVLHRVVGLGHGPLAA